MTNRLLFLLAALTSLPLWSEEGMWTYNNFPSAKVKAKYGFEPTQAWLDRVRLSSVRLAQGCSGSLVSPDGLVMTNHHCAAACIQQLSSANNDYNEKGFLAKDLAEEKKCPALEVNQLVEISDVTRHVQDSTANLSGEAFSKKKTAVIAEIEKACSAGDSTRCDVVSLYHGGIYNLYRYRRYQDVRLVFAPEFAIAFFGGDPDNFMFPRYDLDLSFVRVYDNGKPLQTKHYFPWSKVAAKEGDLTFVSGHPGSTERLKTVAELEMSRDFLMPRGLFNLYEYRGMLGLYATRGAEQKRTVNNDLFGVENQIKADRGEFEALLNKGFFAQKIQDEADFRRLIDANPAWKKEFGSAWDDQIPVLALLRQYVTESMPLQLLGRSRLYANAQQLVFAAVELAKPNSERLPGYTESRLPGLRQTLLSTAPVYKELEIEKLTFLLTKLREDLGPDNPTVKKLLGKEAPRDIATRLVNGTRIDDPAVRKNLLEGGANAVNASGDPMIAFLKLVEPFLRASINHYRKDLEPVLTKIEEKIAKARFAVYGTSVYPDATFSLRLSYGSVKGYMENGRRVNPLTILGGAFERHTGSEPFALPESWLKNKSKLNLLTPFNFASNNDIIGGNSGSPVINKNAEIVGLVFDGNIQSLGGSYGFDESVNRTVAVHSEAIVETLDKIYGAQRILKELGRSRE